MYHWEIIALGSAKDIGKYSCDNHSDAGFLGHGSAHLLSMPCSLMYNPLTYYYWGVYVYLNSNVVQVNTVLFTGSKRFY